MKFYHKWTLSNQHVRRTQIWATLLLTAEVYLWMATMELSTLITKCKSILSIIILWSSNLFFIYIYIDMKVWSKFSPCTSVRMSGASKCTHRNFLHFHILKLLFLSIYCWYFKCFVSTNDMLVGLHVPTNFQNVPINICESAARRLTSHRVCTIPDF